MKRSPWIIVAVGVVLSTGMSVGATNPELPNSFPSYYAPAFVADGVGLSLLTHSITNGVEQWRYGSDHQSVWLSVELIKCNSSQGKILFNNLLGYLDKQVAKQGGRFNVVEKRDAYATITEDEVDRHFFVYRLPHGIQIWTYSMSKESTLPNGQFDLVHFMVNRNRYSDAYKEGNIAMGNWGEDIYDYASVLLQTGKKEEAVKVLGRLISTSPYDYEAHLDFLRNTDDARAATNSAKVVADNAEDEKSVRKAESFLGLGSPSWDSIPYLEQGERGLQVVLIPLPPCDTRLLEEVSRIFEDMTDVTVKIRRLKEEWKWAMPDRFGSQRAIEHMLVQIKEEKIDFTGWTKDKYVKELQTGSADKGAFYRYYVDDMIRKMGNEGGQYRADRYVDNLCRMLEGYCSTDKRTMYVGVTEVNLFSNSNNYVFSQGRTRGKSLASLLSYHMMQASVLGEDYAFRPRLAERLAKELVPASFKQLNIPRSTDPRCPYSYSSGVGRLNEKTLNLSEPLKGALRKLKEMP